LLLNDRCFFLFSLCIDALAELTKNVIAFHGTQDVFGFILQPYLFSLLLQRLLYEPLILLKVLVQPAQPETKRFLLFFFNLLQLLCYLRCYLFIGCVKASNVEGISSISNTSNLSDFLLIFLLHLYFTHFLLNCLFL
jgi:hypothetical protein